MEIGKFVIAETCPILYIYNPFPCIKLSKADFRYYYCYYKVAICKKTRVLYYKVSPGGVDTIHIGKYRYHGWTKATDGCFKRRQPSFFMAVIAAEREINMAITGIGYGRTFVYETQKRVNEGVLQSASDVASRFAESLEESAEENDKVLAPVTRGVRLNRRIEGKDKVPYGEMAENGVIEYEGVVFVCDYDHNRLTLGDTSNEKNCINIPLSGGGSLLVNRNNIDALSKAIGMFSPEDVNRILRALAQDKKIREMEKELDDMENGDDVDSNEETSETTDADKVAGKDLSGTAGESEKEDLSLREQIREKMQEIYDKLQNGDTETKFQIGNQEFSIKEWDNFLEKFDSVQDAIREALEEKIEKQTEEHFEEEDLEETADKKPDVNPDFYDIPEETFRILF